MGAATTPLAIGGGAAQQATSMYAAVQRNKALSAAMPGVVSAGQVEIDQIAESSRIARMQRANQQAQVEGRIRVASGASGGGVGGTYAALLRQAEYDGEVNRYIVDQNAYNQTRRVQSEVSARLQALKNQQTNRIMDAITSSLGGVSTGLKILQIGQQFDGPNTNKGAPGMEYVGPDRTDGTEYA